jgi:hypothetical protein
MGGKLRSCSHLGKHEATQRWGRSIGWSHNQMLVFKHQMNHPSTPSPFPQQHPQQPQFNIYHMSRPRDHEDMSGEMIANEEMIEGYMDGICDNRQDYPERSNRSASYRHGWLNGRDDRIRQPRASYYTLSEAAETAVEQDKGDFTMSAYEKTSSSAGKTGNANHFDQPASYGVVNSVGKARADGSPNSTEPTNMPKPSRFEEEEDSHHKPNQF